MKKSISLAFLLLFFLALSSCSPEAVGHSTDCYLDAVSAACQRLEFYLGGWNKQKPSTIPIDERDTGGSQKKTEIRIHPFSDLPDPHGDSSTCSDLSSARAISTLWIYLASENSLIFYRVFESSSRKAIIKTAGPAS